MSQEGHWSSTKGQPQAEGEGDLSQEWLLRIISAGSGAVSRVWGWPGSDWNRCVMAWSVRAQQERLLGLWALDWLVCI